MVRTGSSGKLLHGFASTTLVLSPRAESVAMTNRVSRSWSEAAAAAAAAPPSPRQALAKQDRSTADTMVLSVPAFIVTASSDELEPPSSGCPEGTAELLRQLGADDIYSVVVSLYVLPGLKMFSIGYMGWRLILGCELP